MAVTGTSTFNLDLSEVVEEAFELAGGEVRSGYDFRTARRSLNLLLLEWANMGFNMWTLEAGSIPLISGTATYDLPVDTIDIIEHYIRTGSSTTQSDINISRIGVSTYASIPNKNATGRPIQMFVNRQITPTVTLWPVPDATSTYTLVYWRLRRLNDAGHGVNTQDIPFRFLPALIAGLAYKLSMKIPEGIPRMQYLKTAYDEAWLLASTEDREKISSNFFPRICS